MARASKYGDDGISRVQRSELTIHPPKPIQLSEADARDLYQHGAITDEQLLRAFIRLYPKAEANRLALEVKRERGPWKYQPEEVH